LNKMINMKKLKKKGWLRRTKLI